MYKKITQLQKKKKKDSVNLEFTGGGISKHRKTLALAILNILCAYLMLEFKMNSWTGRIIGKDH